MEMGMAEGEESLCIAASNARLGAASSFDRPLHLFEIRSGEDATADSAPDYRTALHSGRSPVPATRVSGVRRSSVALIRRHGASFRFAPDGAVPSRNRNPAAEVLRFGLEVGVQNANRP